MNPNPLILLFFLIAFLFMSSCSGSTDTIAGEPEPEDPIEATITLNNNGAREYVVTPITGYGAFSDIDSPNTQIDLTLGGRYTFINNSGASSHPLDFRNEDRTKFFGQSRNAGQFDEDPAVNILRDEDVITFTLTEDLASELFDYVCSFHPGMNGSISLIEK